jgi:hypothetical protein
MSKSEDDEDEEDDDEEGCGEESFDCNRLTLLFSNWILSLAAENEAWLLQLLILLSDSVLELLIMFWCVLFSESDPDPESDSEVECAVDEEVEVKAGKVEVEVEVFKEV